jgi:hypothetical protein
LLCYVRFFCDSDALRRDRQTVARASGGGAAALLGLPWSCADLDRTEVRVGRQLQRISGQLLHRGTKIEGVERCGTAEIAAAMNVYSEARSIG